MRTARLLAIAGATCLLGGAYAWSQGNYHCGSIVLACGTYTSCFRHDSWCHNQTPPYAVQFMKDDLVLGGGCLFQQGSSCVLFPWTCTTRYYTTILTPCGIKVCESTRDIMISQ
jgi:hypothetical protein